MIDKHELNEKDNYIMEIYLLFFGIFTLKLKLIFMKPLNILFISAIIIFSSCKKDDIKTEVFTRTTCGNIQNNELSSSIVSFAIESFKTLEEDQNDSLNIIFSPFSLSVATTMLLNGSSGKTEEIMKDVLHYNEEEMPVINTYLNDITNCISSQGDFILQSANSLWINDTYTVKENFTDSLKKYYHSNLFDEDFSDPNIINTLNSWVKEQTDGTILDLFAEGDVTGIDMFILINSLYFSGNWTYSFDPELTQDSAFTNHAGNDIDVSYMQSNGKEYLYYFDTDFGAVRMPYGNENIALYIFLPDETSNLNDFFNQLNDENWDGWINSFDSLSVYLSESAIQKTWFQVPKFQIEFGMDLKDLMTNLGMGIIYGYPDFSAITDLPIFITNSKQKSFIELNETGTTAGSATFYEGGFGSPPPKFLINRPFFFVIRHENTGVLLFMGKYLHP